VITVPRFFVEVKLWLKRNVITIPAEQTACTRMHYIIRMKGKAIPLQSWTGPEGSRRLRLPDFKTIDI
jgi:hypothetical protein